MSGVRVRVRVSAKGLRLGIRVRFRVPDDDVIIIHNVGDCRAIEGAACVNTKPLISGVLPATSVATDVQERATVESTTPLLGRGLP